MKILFLSRYDRLGASSRIRLYQYFRYLEAHDVEVKASPLLGDDFLKLSYAGQGIPKRIVAYAYIRRATEVIKAVLTSEYDLIWLEKELFPFLPAWGEALLDLLKMPYVVDYDDAVFHSYDHHRNVIVRSLLGGKIERVMRGAAMVIAGNNYLANRARRAGARRVEYLPSVVDLDLYLEQPPPRGKCFTIGWIGSPTTARHHLTIIENMLADFCRDGASRVIAVGSGDLNLPGVPLEVRPWSEESEVSDIRSFDVGIMPLPDNPWERGKCGFKLIQCMACGLPVVASPVGVNRRIVEHGVNGFLASTAEEWTAALTELRDNEELRIVMGKSARRKVEKEYSLQEASPRLLALLRSVAGRHG
ncbi:MAG: glycosyltransferase [Deltaproteobacteria bacterium]|nr:glycosyltransferase [Deltaproteobacteria bacterium]TLN01167.1 MAG: glycosyltransferase family 4 protein [bacterium]